MPRRPPSPVSGRAGGQPPRRRRPAPRADEVPESRPARAMRVLSVRAIVLGVVLLLGFTLLFPTIRAYLGQRAELEALAAQVDLAEQEERSLARELDRWEDPAYVQAQARERLRYVMPGETAYRVIDPEVVVEEEVDPADPTPQTGPTLPKDGEVSPWYSTVWESLEVAGQAPVPGAATPEPEPSQSAPDAGPADPGAATEAP